MAVAYVLSHFDDEYFALPLILEHRRAGRAQHFFYVADYREASLCERRRAESVRFLARWGLEATHIRHPGSGSGAFDGASHRALEAVYERLRSDVATLGPIDSLVTPAWEGGHMDHDVCAVLTAALARELDVPLVEQFSLYNGPGLPGPLFRAAWPLSENGGGRRIALSWRDLVSWAASVRMFPSQLKTWAGLWPAMFASIMLRGFTVQSLTLSRLADRPHAGALLYERMYGVPYAEVRDAIDAFLGRLARRLNDEGQAKEHQDVA